MVINVLTVAHPRFDTRIWIKEISSLVRNGFSVNYYVSDGKGNERLNGVNIVDLAAKVKRKGFIGRVLFMFRYTNALDLKKGDFVHFHDGIFLPFAFILWLKGCRVVYDVHEDYPSQVLNTRFNVVIRFVWSRAMWIMEEIADKIFYRIVAATPHIASKFNPKKTCVVNNYPIISELNVMDNRRFENRSLTVAYVGGISKIRGIVQVLEALVILNKHMVCNLELAGSFDSLETQNLVVSHEGWKYVKFHGWANRQDVAEILNSARLGLAIFHPSPNHINAQPNKLFEYMSAGLPVIVSDFPLWKEIIESSKCGLVVNPKCSNSIAKAVDWIMSNPKEAEKMGENGKQAVLDKYNWGREEKKLIGVYDNEVNSQT